MYLDTNGLDARQSCNIPQQSIGTDAASRSQRVHAQLALAVLGCNWVKDGEAFISRDMGDAVQGSYRCLPDSCYKLCGLACAMP